MGVKLKGYQPLCLIDNKVLLYKKGKFIIYDEKNDSFQEVLHFETSNIKKILESSRLLSRIFRTDIRCALALNNEELLVLLNKALYYASLTKKNVQKIFEMREGFTNPLNLCRPLKEESNCVALFGDYGNNANNQSVSIYGVKSDLTVQILHTFPSNTIRHIHNIICDEINNGYYIFTGDNEEKAGIYWIDKKFSKIEPILIGKQNARAVCGFVTDKGLLYATDSVTEQNYIYLLTQKNSEPSLQVIEKINGSCIYATEYCGGYVFSTTVESGESNGRRFSSLLSMKRGKGIISDEVHLIHISRKLKSDIIESFKKDKLPYKLFQYGAVRFPTGLENSDKLIIYPCAIKGLDGYTILKNVGGK
ncbi:MAG: hypothetical protein ACOCRO_02600 [Halanaerobiales bacterium]